MKFRKKPIEVQALQWTGENVAAMTVFARGAADINDGVLKIVTLEGTMKASIGDWIIRGTNGEFYPCNPDIFESTYDAVED